MSLKLLETKKLHYGEYLYKLTMSNPLAPIFRSSSQRGGILTHTKVVLDDLTRKYREGEPLKKITYRASIDITEAAYLDAKDIYSVLKKSTNYKLCCKAGTVLGLYSNDRDMLVKLSKKMRTSLREFWEPRPEAVEILKTKEHLVISNNPLGFEYQLHLSWKAVDLGFYTWAVANGDKVRIGPKTLKAFQRGYANGSYIYVRDDRVLTLVELLIGHAMRKVDKIVYTGDIDKYKYDIEQ